MGRYEDALRRRIVERRLKDRYKFPAGWKGMVMWCPLCTEEIARAPADVPLSIGEQQLAVDTHSKTCRRRRLKLVGQSSGR